VAPADEHQDRRRDRRASPQAFEKYPLHFDALFCNLVGAGEAGGYPGDACSTASRPTRKRSSPSSRKIKSALFYPLAIIVVAFVITAIIMIFVIPAFKQVFTNFGADLPAPTLFVMAVSDFFVEYWYLIFGGVGGGVYGFFWKPGSARSPCRSSWTG
jgi:type IV pilus assembly protein PilC